MGAIKLSFVLRTNPKIKQVHLIGSWDAYKTPLPLASDGSKWKGTFSFKSSVMEPGATFWFYYMLDGHKACHDPSKDYTVEPTTGRKLNILVIPKSAVSSHSSSSSSSSSKSSHRQSLKDIPRGKPAAEIRSPKPMRPGHLVKKLEDALVDKSSRSHHSSSSSSSDRRIGSRQHSSTSSSTSSSGRKSGSSRSSSSDSSDQSHSSKRNAIYYPSSPASSSTSYNEDSDIDSDTGSDCPSLMSGSFSDSSSGCSTPSSPDGSTSPCYCGVYGVTRRGQRIKLDCGGARCGYYSDDDNDSDSCVDYEVDSKL